MRSRRCFAEGDVRFDSSTQRLKGVREGPPVHGVAVRSLRRYGCSSVPPTAEVTIISVVTTEADGKGSKGAMSASTRRDSVRPSSCPIARTLAIIGDRWSILILRDLLRNPSLRFQDLEASLAGIGPNTLSGRLKTLEEHGIVARRLYAEHPPRAEYFLTDKGRELGPALKALLVWGQKNT